VIDQVKNILIAVTIALTVGFGVGFYTKGKFVDAAIIKQVNVSHKESASNIIKSNETSTKIESKVENVKKAGADIRQQIARHIETKEKKDEVSKKPDDCRPVWTLDARTYWLLRASREATTFDPASISDDEGEASTGITQAEIFHSATEVHDEYNELAIRHGELVDYVDGLIKAQAK
jgi:ribosomal protein S13